ncbi:MAG: SRPBCC family protein [Rhodobacteraceae bacterium]|nr:SRPBCC family protein [Paracoccaceae bacterium]
MPSQTAGVMMALVAGAVVAGGLMVARREAEQRRRVARHPDDAPAPTRRALFRNDRVVSRSVTINKPRAELYAFWRDFQNLPAFMENIEKVTPTDAGRAVWTIAAPGGASVDLETEITQDRPDELIAWRSVEGSDITAEGEVRFSDAPADRGTIVEAEVRYRPPGGELGRLIAALFQREPAIQARRELKRFKMLMETGEIATSRNRVDA